MARLKRRGSCPYQTLSNEYIMTGQGELQVHIQKVEQDNADLREQTKAQLAYLEVSF